MGLPVDGDDPTVVGLKADMKSAKGKMGFLQTGDWGATWVKGTQT